MATFAPNASSAAGIGSNAIVQRMFFNHHLVTDGRGTGLSFTPGGNLETRHSFPPLLPATSGPPPSQNESHLVCPQPPRAMRITHIKPLRLSIRPAQPFNVREGSCRITYATSQKPDGVTVVVAWGSYALNGLITAIQGAMTAAGDTFSSFTETSINRIYRVTCSTAGATWFTFLPARSDRVLMEAIGFLTANPTQSLSHVANVRCFDVSSNSTDGFLRDLGYYMCLRNTASTTLVTPEVMRTSDAIAFFPYDAGGGYAGTGTSYAALRDVASPSFLPVNVPLHGADFFLRDNTADFREIPPIAHMSWVFEAEVVLVPL